MLEDRFAEGAGQLIGDTFVDPTAAYEMSVRDYRVRPDCSGGGFTLTLPPVAEAKGRWYSVILRAGNGLVIEDNNDDSECWQGDVTLDGACDRFLAYSDGMAWIVVLAPGFWPGFDTTAAPGTTTPPTTAAPSTAAGQTTAAPTTAAPTTAAPTTA